MLRDFRPGDQRAVREPILAGLEERWGEPFDASVNPDLNDVVRNYLDRGAEVVVVESNGELVATGILVRDKADAGRIRARVSSRALRASRFGPARCRGTDRSGAPQRDV